VTRLLETARSGWALVAGNERGFVTGIANVAVAPDSGLAPTGWCGIVQLGDSLIATAPDERSAAILRAALSDLDPIDSSSMSRLADSLTGTTAWGPTALLFGDAPSSVDNDVLEFDVHSTEVRELLLACSEEEVEESAVRELPSVFAVMNGGRVVSAAGYVEWPGRLAHISVLTRPDGRRRGFARIAASAAMRVAIEEGLTVQWRARPEPSRLLALSLGLVELGSQFSVRL
jgi:hypothetical protein